MEKAREIWIHVCMICTFICMITEVLDWYNPYMDFSGHILFARAALYFGVCFLTLTRKKSRRPTGKKCAVPARRGMGASGGRRSPNRAKRRKTKAHV